MAEMTSRERILAALDHREPDRLPLDFGGRVTTLHAFAHRELKRYLGLEGGEEQIRSYHTYVVEPDPRLIARFGRDTVFFSPNPGSDWEMHIDPATRSYVDEWGTKYYMPPDGYYFDVVETPLADAATAADLDRYPWPDPRDAARLRGLAAAVKEAYQAADKAIMFCSPTVGLWAMSWYLRGFEQAYLDLAGDHKLADELAERVLQWQIAFWDEALPQVGPYVDLIQVEGDLGATGGPLFSPAVFRKVYKPRLARLIAAIRQKTRARIWLHSCGSVYWALPDLIECGVAVLNPVQVNARDMDTARLKREFGRDITFWGGGCDPVVLQNGTPQEVEAEVRRRIDDLAPGGGFVFGSVHNIQANVPPENIVAMYEAARRHGGWET